MRIIDQCVLHVYSKNTLFFFLIPLNHINSISLLDSKKNNVNAWSLFMRIFYNHDYLLYNEEIVYLSNCKHNVR